MQHSERRELLLPDGFVVAVNTRPRKGPFVRLRAVLIVYMIPLVLASLGIVYVFIADDWAFAFTFLIYALGIQAGSVMQYHNGYNDATRKADRHLREAADVLHNQSLSERDMAMFHALVTRVRAEIGPLGEQASFHRSQMEMWTGPVLRTHSFPVVPPSRGYLTHVRLRDLRAGDRVLKGQALGGTVQTAPEPIGEALLVRIRDDDTQQVSERVLGADSVLVVGRDE